MALLRSDPEQRAGYAAIIATLEGQDPLATTSSPERDLLVGRERELRELYDALGSTRAGRPGAALVSVSFNEADAVNKSVPEIIRSDLLITLFKQLEQPKAWLLTAITGGLVLFQMKRRLKQA